MGACCSAPGAELPPATKQEIDQLKERGHLPCIAGPSIDFEGKNQLQTIYVAVYEHGTEFSLLFLDEDRPNACEDCLYDYLRRPLFGRFSDIESFFILNDDNDDNDNNNNKTCKVEFPGTYSADQNWSAKVPSHNEATVDLSKFETNKDGNPVIWVNTWNHLIGEQNNNTKMEITYQEAQYSDTVMETIDNKDFVIRKGSRAEVDMRFQGCISSVSEVMTPERAQKLGKRLF